MRAGGPISARTASGFLSCLLLTAVLSGCGATPPAGRRLPDVLLIVVDAMRADHLGTYGYGRDTSPAIDGIAAGGIVFDSAFATASRTRTSMASLLTSLHPIEHGVRFPFRRSRDPGDVKEAATLPRLIQGLEDNLVTMAECFSDAGYRTLAVVTNPYLKREHGFAQGFQSYVERDLDARAVVDAFLDLWDADPNRPTFGFLHFIDVHAPYDPPPPYDSMFGIPEKDWDGETARIAGRLLSADKKTFRDVMENQIDSDSPVVDVFRSRYDGEIRYVDDSLERLFDALRERGRFESTMVIVTADHGDEFLEHGRMGHGDLLYDDLIRVPLIMRLPGGAAASSRIPEVVSLIDVMPTVLAISGLPLPEGLSGRNLAAGLLDPEPGPEESTTAYSELIQRNYRREAIRTPRYKLIRTLYYGPGDPGTDDDDTTAIEVFQINRPPQRQEIELYDLSADPGETTNLSARNPDLVDGLVAEMDAHLQALRPRVDLSRVLHEIDPEMEERLRSLGYLE